MPPNPLFELHNIFTPLILGSVSLVAFLSLRNTYLAGRARDLCDKLREAQAPFWEASFSLQLLYFVQRYKMSNTALLLAIASIAVFGLMIGGTALSHKQWTTDMSVEFPSIMLLVGGLTTIAATALSMYETFISRRSLFTHVASTIVGTRFSDADPPLLATLKRLEQLIHKSLDRDLYGKFIETQRKLAVSIGTPPTKEPAAEGQADAKPTENTHRPCGSESTLHQEVLGVDQTPCGDGDKNHMVGR